MTLPQALAFSIVGGAVVCFAWGRFRYDVIALIALLAGVAVGIVPVKRAFSGFTSDVVVIIACALVISTAVARSGIIEQLLQPVLVRLKTSATQVPVMAGATAVLSMFTKNVGALAILMPVAIRMTRNTGTSRSSITFSSASSSSSCRLVVQKPERRQTGSSAASKAFKASSRSSVTERPSPAPAPASAV